MSPPCLKARVRISWASAGVILVLIWAVRPLFGSRLDGPLPTITGGSGWLSIVGLAVGGLCSDTVAGAGAGSPAAAGGVVGPPAEASGCGSGRPRRESFFKPSMLIA